MLHSTKTCGCVECIKLRKIKIFLQSQGERRMMDSGDQFGVGAVFQEYGEHLAAEGEVKELLRGTTRLINWTLFLLGDQ